MQKKTWYFEITCFTAFGHHRIWRIEHTFSAKSLANAFKSSNTLHMQCWRCYMREFVFNVYLLAMKIFYIIWKSIVTLLTFYNFIFSLESLIDFIVKRSVQYTLYIIHTYICCKFSTKLFVRTTFIRKLIQHRNMLSMRKQTKKVQTEIKRTEASPLWSSASDIKIIF